jgi:hypothetical protein
MKNSLLVFCTLFFLLIASAQEQAPPLNITLKWAPAGLILGNISFQGEYSFGKQSLTAKIGIPVNSRHTLQYEGNDAEFDMKASAFLAGYRVYLSKIQLRGLYFEPYFKYIHHSSEGYSLGKLSYRNVNWNFTNEYNGAGLGVQLGSQFLIGKRFIIDLFFLGPEINTASNHFKAVEKGSSIVWTPSETQEAERDIKDFINKFPFLRNNTSVMVDATNHTVTADFKGAIPGFRIGVAFGIAL